MDARATARRPQRHSVVAMAFHWAIAAVIFLQLGLGWRMQGADWRERAVLFGRHRSIGMTLLVLSVWRLVWKWASRPPEPPDLTAAERLLSSWTHRVLYFLLLALPLTGWIVVSVEGSARGIRLFEAIPWPLLPGIASLPPNGQQVLASASDATHGALVWALVALLALHVAGALKHLLWSRDGVAGRMMPGAVPGAAPRARVMALPMLVVAAFALAFLVSSSPGAKSPRPTVARVADADVFLDVVQPALERRCASCHNDARSRGGLSLVSHDGIMAGGLHGPAVVAGDSAGGELLRRIALEPSHKEYMPAGGRTALTASQVQALKWWVAIGAPAKGAAGDFSIDAPDTVALAQVLHLASAESAAAGIEGLPSVNAADPAVVSALTSAGFNIRRVSPQSNLLDINRYRRTPLSTEDLDNLRKLGAQIRTLRMRSSGIADAQLDGIGQMPHLALLALDGNPLTDAGLERLARLRELRTVSVTETRVTGAGVLTLARMPSLERVYVWGASAALDATARVRAVNPRLQVIYEVVPAAAAPTPPTS